MGPDRATCIAERGVGTMGLDSLISAGFIDEDMTFQGQDLATVDPAFKAALGTATTRVWSEAPHVAASLWVVGVVGAGWC
ncbi:hypothetical protein [uncultured Nocardioides sp.]|uniref:hypothetical protein n=1 Tax=uncultured Nocardioides sp. TaxID=198441 RepID=UPI0025CCE1A9|nr:hypothetical protein [uncultured Nocardioides sp.]